MRIAMIGTLNAWELRGTWSRTRDRFLMWLARRLPNSVVYFAVIEASARAMHKWPRRSPERISTIDLLKMLEK